MRGLAKVYHLSVLLLLIGSSTSVRQSHEIVNSQRRNGLQRHKPHHRHHDFGGAFDSDEDLRKFKKHQPKDDDFELIVESDEYSINDSGIGYDEYNSDEKDPLHKFKSREDTTMKPYEFYSCCDLAYGSCREKCHNLQLAKFTKPDGLRWELKKNCPVTQMDFWNCMNITIEAVANGTNWSGRRCCHLGFSIDCQNACATSKSFKELTNACRWSDEQLMVTCFERYENHDKCCKNARTSECLQACVDVFEPHANEKQSDRYHNLKVQCTEKNRDVVRCVQNVINIEPINEPPHKFLPCCKFSKGNNCRQKCRTIISSSESMEIALMDLESSGCGNNLPNFELWQCFLNSSIVNPTTGVAAAGSGASSQASAPKLNELGFDPAKLHCCEKADSKECRGLCVQLYSKNLFQTRELFENSCLANPLEMNLKQCIDEVDQPCELGCDGLNFCTNFNNRPTELFRSCSADFDLAAQEDLKLLQQNGSLNIFGMNLFIKNTTKCAPDKWKAIVCALHLKPCTREKHFNNICREDCYELLSECLDWTQLGDSLNGHQICARLTPNDPNVETPCISLKPYLEESDVPKDTAGLHDVTLTCKGSPCKESETCIPGRNGTVSSFHCTAGCLIGEASNYLIPMGAYVRLPSLETMGYKVCRCGEKGRIQHCQLLPSASQKDCVLPNSSTKHGSTFYLDCNVCSCFAEEMTCTKRQCRYPGYTDITFTSLPCNCPTHYVPVCGWNGITYHSACLAKCMGLQDTEFEYGACSSFDPCRNGSHVCSTNSQCFPHRKVCLSNMQKPCEQSVCVNQTSVCEGFNEPVCDTKSQTHTSICSLHKSQEELAYWGSCQKGCSMKGPVCGINGVTYPHECSAWADYILVDYKGRCREVGLIANDMGQRCRTVKCPFSPSRYCHKITPPGACCPICAGGALRIIYSRKQLDRALYALRKKHNNLLTLQSLLRELDSMVQVAECQLTGMVAIESGLFVAIVPRSPKPSHIQIEACAREAERLSNLISSQSHKITTNLVLSSLIVSHMIDVNLESLSLSPSPSLALLFLSLLILLFHYRKL